MVVINDNNNNNYNIFNAYYFELHTPNLQGVQINKSVVNYRSTVLKSFGQGKIITSKILPYVTHRRLNEASAISALCEENQAN